MNQMKILIVEDHKILSRNISEYLKIKSIDSEVIHDWDQALYLASTKNFDAIILDINLPGIQGDKICKKLREKWNDTPILMLTSNSSKSDMIWWLQIWADDYMVKPFDYEELLVRIQALTRRNLKNKSTTTINIADLSINLENKQVLKDWVEVKLSHLEFDLLKYFAQNEGKILTREDIYEKVWWEYDAFRIGKTVDVYIWYLRKKLGKDIIHTKKGFWYIIKS